MPVWGWIILAIIIVGGIGLTIYFIAQTKAKAAEAAQLQAQALAAQQAQAQAQAQSGKSGSFWGTLGSLAGDAAKIAPLFI